MIHRIMYSCGIEITKPYIQLYNDENNSNYKHSFTSYHMVLLLNFSIKIRWKKLHKTKNAIAHASITTNIPLTKLFMCIYFERDKMPIFYIAFKDIWNWISFFVLINQNVDATSDNRLQNIKTKLTNRQRDISTACKILKSPRFHCDFIRSNSTNQCSANNS